MDKNNTFYAMHETDKKSMMAKFSIIMMMVIMVLIIIISIYNKRIVVDVINLVDMDNLASPLQVEITDTEELTKYKGYELKKVATFEITGRIITIREFYSEDKSRIEKEVIDKISPMDMCIVWGKLSTSKNDTAISFYEKTERYVDYKINDTTVLGYREAIMSMSNVNIIPKTNRILKELQTFKSGEIIKLQGYLVEAYDKDEKLSPSITSVERTDQGKNGNEIMLVEKVYRVEKEQPVDITLTDY